MSERANTLSVDVIQLLLIVQLSRAQKREKMTMIHLKQRYYGVRLYVTHTQNVRMTINEKNPFHDMTGKIARNITERPLMIAHMHRLRPCNGKFRSVALVFM